MTMLSLIEAKKLGDKKNAYKHKAKLIYETSVILPIWCNLWATNVIQFGQHMCLKQTVLKQSSLVFPGVIQFFEDNQGNRETICEVCSKLAIKTP